MALASGGNSMNVFYSQVENPPPIFDAVGRFDKELHDEVYRYAMAHFHLLAQDTMADNYRRNCIDYGQFYTGSERVIKKYDELEIRQVNLLQMYMQLKHSKLLGDRLHIHYISNKNSDFQFAQAMSQLFDWHSKKIRRDRLQQRIELCAPLYGTVGALYNPKNHWEAGKQVLIPADYEYLDPRCLFFEGRWDKDEELPVFAVRVVGTGRLEDADNAGLLKQRGIKEFERGSSLLSSSPEILDAARSMPTITHNFLNEIDNRDVEVLRVWIKDHRRHKMDVYYPEFLSEQNNQLDPDTITPVVQEAFQQADAEWGLIIDDAQLPDESEHHWAHYVKHRMQVDKAEKAGADIDEIQLGNLKAHMDVHLKYHKKQPPDDEREGEFIFKGGRRFIKIIGQQVVWDGSIEFDYEQFPVALFHNLINPESIIGISDIENLLALQDDLNNLLNMEIVNAAANAYPTRIMPDTLKDVEVVKKGPYNELYVEDKEQGDIIRNLEAPRNSGGNRELIMILQQFMQMITGGTSVVQGEVPKTRTSAAGIMSLQQQASQRYTASQYSLNDGWQRSATIWLAQMKQFWKDEIFLPPIVPEYRESTKILNESIDPSAHLIVERVPQDINYQEQVGAQSMQAAMLFAQGGIPFDAVVELMATQYDGSTPSRVASQLTAILKKPEHKEAKAKQEQMEAMEMMKSNSKAGK